MKSHTVKSNAKRAARQMAAKFSGVDVIEPVAAPDGGWFAAVKVAPGCLASAVAPEVYEAAVVVTDESAPGHTDLMVPPETLDALMAANPLPETVETEVETIDLPAFLPTSPAAEYAEAGTVSPAEIRAIALADPVRSSPEEIAARRKARRERLAAKPEASEPPAPVPTKRRAATADGAPKTDQMIEMLRRPNGATAIEIATMLGWQKHTARARISVECRARGIAVSKTHNDKARGGNVYRAAV